jgi:MFS transporter, DHA1 family, multidrug resistance protein
MISRFMQAFGGSTGSVLGQVICRDTFTGADRGKVFSLIGSALAFSPAIGPVIGGVIAQSMAWSAVFMLLALVGLIVMFFTFARLPETYMSAPFSLKTIKQTVFFMMRDSQVLMAGYLVAACNGISFSYFAEGPFYLITLLGLSPFLYGVSFIFFAFAGMIGSYASKKAHDYGFSSYSIMQQGQS